MPPTKKPFHTSEERLAALEHNFRNLEKAVAELAAGLLARTETAPERGLDDRVVALEAWRRALRKHTHQFLHDTGWQEPE